MDIVNRQSCISSTRMWTNRMSIENLEKNKIIMRHYQMMVFCHLIRVVYDDRNQHVLASSEVEPPPFGAH
jgi:hypothetical protein